MISPGFAVWKYIIGFRTDGPTMFGLPRTMTLLAYVVFVEQIALEIFQSVASIFQEEATAKVMPLIIELMIHGQIP